MTKQEINRRYREKHKEELKIKSKERCKRYREEHKEEIKQKRQSKEYKEYQKEYYKKYKETHKEEIKIRSKKYYENNKDKILNRINKLNEDGIPYYAEVNRNKSKYKDKLSVIDYKSGVKENNTAKLLSANSKSQSNNRYSKRRGVYKCRNKWIASLQKNGIVYRKSFDTYEEAVAYREYLEEIHFDNRQKQLKEYFENQQK